MNTKRIERLNILCATDRPLWDAGVVFAGMDEAGRGPLAGNVVAACVIMPPEPLLEWVDDSKKLSEKRREVVFEDILEGVQGAKAGGFRAVGVYDQRNRKNEEAIRAASDRYIRSFTELSSDENLF